MLPTGSAPMVCLWWLLAALQLALGAQHRLSRSVRPRHYDLALLYDLDPATNFSFFAKVDILLAAEESTSKIYLHGQGFKISRNSAKMSMNGTVAMEVTRIKMDSNFLTVFLGHALAKGENYTLSIAFYGNLTKGVDGAYISSYVDKKTNNTEYLIATKFGPISARKAFPCFDEPSFKATFRISIGHQHNFSAISNMPFQTSSYANALKTVWPWSTINETFKKNQEQFVWDHFNTSLPMSTYLVAWVVSKFTSVESKTETNFKIRIWTRPGVIDQTQYALAIGPRVMDNYNKWFAIPFPLPKLDMVAIPGVPDPASESWGLILNAEEALLYDEIQHSPLNKEIVTYVIAHELAHQWFGNLVTMSWWSELWLYEGFATYITAVNVANAEPEWESENNHAGLNMLSVLSKDLLESSHPVSVTIEDPNQIRGAFDAISFRKGYVLVRMLAKILGELAFREGIRNYLLKYSFKNAGQDELWQEMTVAKQGHGGFSRDISLKTVMDTWNTQTGYPVLNVTRDYVWGQYLYVTQLFNKTSSTSPSWWVPLRVQCQNDSTKEPDHVEWLAAHEGLELVRQYQHSSNDDSWVLLNTDMIAPYRVNYDNHNWELLARTLHTINFTVIPMLSRVQLVSDALSLAWNGQLNYGIALYIVTYLNNETNYLPIKAGLDGLSRIEVFFMRSPGYGVFQNFIRNLISDAYASGGGIIREATNETSLKNTRMQVLLSDWACRVELETCQETAIELFQMWMDTKNPDRENPVPMDFRPTVYCTAIARGKVEHWNFLLARENVTKVAAESAIILRALACSEEVWILSRYLEWAITPNSEVRWQDATAVMEGVIRSKVGFLVAKEFIYNRIEDIFNAFVGREAMIGTLLKALASQFTMKFDVDEFVKWHRQNKQFMVGSERQVEEAEAEARKNIIWLKKYRNYVLRIMTDSFPEKHKRAELSSNTTMGKSTEAQLSITNSISSGATSKIFRWIFRTSVIYVIVWTFLTMSTNTQ